MQPFQKTLTIVQVIIIALAAGLIILAAIIIYMVHQVKPGGFFGNDAQQGRLTSFTIYMSGGNLFILLMSLIPHGLIMRMQLEAWKKQAQPVEGEFASWESNDLTWLERVPAKTLTPLLQLFQSNRIINAAGCEVAGMLSALTYLLEAHWIALAMVVLSIVFMLAKVPTKTSLNTWLFTQIEQLPRKQ